MDISDISLIETNGGPYPGRFWHIESCPNAKRAAWPSQETGESVARSLSSHVAGLGDAHRCLRNSGEVWTTILRRSGEIRNERFALQRRQTLLTDFAVATVALARLEEEVGPMTESEAENFQRSVEALRAGTYHPRGVRDLRAYAIAPRTV